MTALSLHGGNREYRDWPSETQQRWCNAGRQMCSSNVPMSKSPVNNRVDGGRYASGQSRVARRWDWASAERSVAGPQEGIGRGSVITGTKVRRRRRMCLCLWRSAVPPKHRVTPPVSRALATSEPRCYFRRIKVSRICGDGATRERRRTCDVLHRVIVGHCPVWSTRKSLLQKKREEKGDGKKIPDSSRGTL